MKHSLNRRRPRSGIATPHVILVGLLLLVSAAALHLYFRQTVQNKVCGTIQSKIDERLSGTVFAANVETARFHEGRGIELRDFTLYDRENPDHPLVQAYQAFLHVPVQMTELVTCDATPTAIELRRVKLNLVRDADGTWNIDTLFKSLSAKDVPSQDRPLMPIYCRDSMIRVIDKTTQPPIENHLRDIELEIRPIDHQGKRLIAVSATASGATVAQLQVSGWIDPVSAQWGVECDANRAALSTQLFALLPSQLQPLVSPLHSIGGDVDFHGRAQGSFASQCIPDFEVTGNVSRLAIEDARLPLPISHCQGQFRITDSGLELTNATGRLGVGPFKISYWQEGLLQQMSWRAEGKLQNLNFDDRLAARLPQFCQKFCKNYAPVGTLDIDFSLEHDGTKLHKDLRGQLTNMSFKYAKFPFQINRCVGNARWTGDVCTYDLQALEGQQVIRFQGSINNPGPNSTYVTNIAVIGDLPIDAKLLAAIDVSKGMSRVVRAFRPAGRAGIVGRIERRKLGEAVQKKFDIQLKQCNVRHESFDYPMYNVNGMIYARNGEYTFEEITGTSGSGQAICNGTWTKANGLALRFLCNSVELDEQLRNALSSKLQELWQGFRPQGNVSLVRVDLRLPRDQHNCDVAIEATLTGSTNADSESSVSIHPTWFPYAIDKLTGKVFIGDGQIKLTDIKGKHDRTWLVCQGEGRYDEERWAVALKQLLVGSLQVGEDLLNALPESLAPTIRALEYQGMVNVFGEITLAGLHARPSGSEVVQGGAAKQSWSPHSLQEPAPADRWDFAEQNRNQSLVTPVAYTAGTHSAAPGGSGLNYPASTSMAWDLRFDMDAATVQIGLPVENIFGNIQLAGQYDGQSAECVGQINIDSLTIHDVQITDVHGPISIDNQRAAVGGFAVTGSGNLETTQRSVVGNVFGGQLKFDGQISSDDQFFVQASLADARLEHVVREAAPQFTNCLGKGFAALRLSGKSRHQHSYQGNGTIQLRDAQIYELPLVVALLKILRVREVTRTAFDSGNIDFSVQGENVDLNRIELIGDAISLIGNGQMNFDRQIDLNFYSVVGRNRIYIPIISEMYRAGSQQILWINVDGSLSEPELHRHVLPQLNDSIRFLLEPRNPGDSFFELPDGSLSSRGNRQHITGSRDPPARTADF